LYENIDHYVGLGKSVAIY